MKLRIGPFVVSTVLFLYAVPALAQTHAQNLMWAEALKGAAAMASGFSGRARAHFKAGLRKVDSPELRAAMALTYLHQGQARAALALLSGLAGRQAALPQLHYWRGRIRLALRQPAKACRLMDLALSLGGDRPVYLVAKAVSCKEAGRTGVGVRALVRAARMNPDLTAPSLYPDPVYGVLELVQKSLKTFPNPRKAMVALAHLFFRARYFGRAEKLSDRIRARFGQIHDALFVKAQCRLAVDDLGGALAWTERVLGNRSSDPAALALRAEIHLMAGRSSKAISDLERAVRLNPAHAVNLSRLAMLNWEKGHYAKAERLFRYSLVRNGRLASAHHGLALALDRRKKTVQAAAHHRRAIRLSPANPVYRKAFAIFLQRQKNDRLARSQLKTARKLDVLAKKFKNSVDRATAYTRSLHGVIKLYRAGKKREAKSKLAIVRGPRAPVFYLKAHFEAATKRAASNRARRALAGLASGKLLNPATKVMVLETRGKAGPNLPVVLRRYLPSANPNRFR